MNFHLLPAFNAGPMTGQGNNTYLLPGRQPTLIDAGTGELRHLDALAALVDRAAPLSVLVTHAHPDHAAGSAAISEGWPHANFYKLPWPERDTEYVVRWRALEESELVPAGDGHLRVIRTPGHSPDHVCFWDETERTLFGGDLVLAGGTVVIPPSHGGNLSQYLASLERAIDLQPACVAPAHGPMIEQPLPRLREYLAHRRRRERQLVHALQAGRHTLEELVENIYDGLGPDLLGAARENVSAHLIKLQDEGRVARSGDRFELVQSVGAAAAAAQPLLRRSDNA